MNLQEQIARIEQRQEEVRRCSAEMRATSAQDGRAVWIFPLGGIIAGAAIFGAGAVMMKVLGA
ncbi:hypothetical protein [Afipia sp. DC4300-2b1]|uniref:hypothetical protein n=1 Tax=Afipia sp. DC4300-2b1 TaxID=2804672 RepID=UPI003CF4A229